MQHNDEEMKSVVERYSTEAQTYEDTWAPILLPHSRVLLAALQLGRASRILDAGSGVGTLLPEIQMAAPSAHVVAADGSEGMLARAPKRFPRTVMDLACLGFEANTFDVVVMAFVLFHVREPERALREVSRVMRAGGTVGTITWEGDPCFPAQKAFLEELDEHGAGQGSPFFTDHAAVSSQIRMREMLQRACFGSVTTWTTVLNHQYTMEEFIAIRTSRGQTRQRFESLGQERRDSFLHHVRNRLMELGPAGFLDQTSLIYATGIRA